MFSWPTEAQRAYFWSHVRYRPGSECWPWTGTRDRAGYGQCSAKKWAGTFMAHRIMYRLMIGPLADDELALHHCDNPPCVNPAHLWKGSNYDNVRDCLAKGRHPTNGKPTCKHGHVFGGANAKMRWDGPCCRECAKRDTRNWKKRSYAALNQRLDAIRAVPQPCQSCLGVGKRSHWHNERRGPGRRWCVDKCQQCDGTGQRMYKRVPPALARAPQPKGGDV